METMVSISSEQPYSTEVRMSFERDGSIGKLAIDLPRGVRSPTLSRAPSAQRSNREVVMVS